MRFVAENPAAMATRSIGSSVSSNNRFARSSRQRVSSSRMVCPMAAANRLSSDRRETPVWATTSGTWMGRSALSWMNRSAGRHKAVILGDDVGRAPRATTPPRLHQHFMVPLDSTGHQSVQKRRGFVSTLFKVQCHARQRRIRKLTHQLVVVHSHDRHLIRDGDSRQQTGIQHLARLIIVAGHQPGRPGQLSQPSSQRIAIPFPLLFSWIGRHRDGGTPQPLLRQRPTKLLLTSMGPEAVGQAAIGKVPEAPIDEMLGRCASDGGRIGTNFGNA